MSKALGQIILLNGTPRAGKTSIARALQETSGALIFGVDALMAMTPDHLLPGVGLRPGGERPDLEEFVRQSYCALFECLATMSREGLSVISDVGLHDRYSRALGIVEEANSRLEGLPVLWVGVRCPIVMIMDRRNADDTGNYMKGDTVPVPVQLWQESVHLRITYDVEVDTSVLTPKECADRIRQAASPLANSTHLRVRS